MSCLYEKRGWYYLRFSVNGVAQSRALKTQDEWKARQLQLNHDQRSEAKKTGLAPRSLVLSSVLSEFLDKKRGMIVEETHRRYRDYTKRILEWMATQKATQVQDLSSAVIENYARARLEIAASKTTRDELLFLKMAIKSLIEESLLDADPVRKWPSIKVRARNPEKLGPYSADELGRIRIWFREQNHYFSDIFQACIFTGCRIGEIALLRSSDYFPTERNLRVRSPKTEGSGLAERYIEVRPELAEIFARRTGEFIFPELSEAHSRNWGRRAMHEACDALGIQYRRVHGLRHSFGSYLLDGGVSPKLVQAAMGHTSMGTTLKYIGFVKPKDSITGKLPY